MSAELCHQSFRAKALVFRALTAAAKRLNHPHRRCGPPLRYGNHVIISSLRWLRIIPQNGCGMFAGGLPRLARPNSTALDLVLSGHPLVGAAGLANASKWNTICFPVVPVILRAVGGVFRIGDVFDLRAPTLLLLGQPVFSAPRALLFETGGNSACVVACSLVFVLQETLKILPLSAANPSFPGQQAIHIPNPLAVGKFIRSSLAQSRHRCRAWPPPENRSLGRRCWQHQQK